MFVIFIFSAIVSGISVLIFHYFVVSWINRWKVDEACVKILARQSPLAADLRSFGGSPDERYLIVDGTESASEIADSVESAGYRPGWIGSEQESSVA